jgi:hypothetical protein
MAQKKGILLVKSFSLIELMLATAFLTFVFGTLIVSFVACFLLNEANRNLSIATTHAQYILEEIKDAASAVTGFNNLIANGTSQWNWSYTGTDFSSRSLSVLSNETTTVTLCDAGSTGCIAPTSSTELLDITVTVNWHDRARARTMSLETLVAQP